MELEEVNITPDHPLLLEKHGDSEGEAVTCSYTHHGAKHETSLHVAIQGDRSISHAMVTFHDVGLNSVSNYGPLMNSEAMQPVAHKYCIYHINAPGQENGATPLPTGFVYPSMENLADMIPKVFSHFGIESAICIGSGAGANAFIRFALKNPSMVEGLILVNPTVSTVGNLSWIGEKITNLTTPFHDQVLNYHFTKAELDQVDHELIERHRKHFKQHMNEHNVHLFFNEYERRHEINLVRSIPPHTDKTTLSCRTLILAGDMSPFVDDAVEVNARLDPAKSTFLKMADAGGMVLEEQIFKVAESFIYFLQGLGHIPGVMMTRLARSRTISNSSIGSGEGDTKRIRTLSGGSVENKQSPSCSRSVPAMTRERSSFDSSESERNLSVPQENNENRT